MVCPLWSQILWWNIFVGVSISYHWASPISNGPIDHFQHCRQLGIWGSPVTFTHLHQLTPQQLNYKAKLLVLRQMRSGKARKKHESRVEDWKPMWARVGKPVTRTICIDGVNIIYHRQKNKKAGWNVAVVPKIQKAFLQQPSTDHLLLFPFIF